MDPWKIKNGQRLRLLDKKFSVGLDAKEEAELAELKREVYDYVQLKDPRIPEDVEAIDARFDRLKQRIIAKRGNKP